MPPKKDKQEFLNFPPSLVEAGYKQTLMSSILKRSIKDQKDFDESLNLILPYVDSMQILVKPFEGAGVGFTTTNISSILHGSGQNVGVAIEALTSGAGALKELVTPFEDGKVGFTTANISSILNGSGKNVGAAIGALTAIIAKNSESEAPITKEIITRFCYKMPKSLLVKINDSNSSSVIEKIRGHFHNTKSQPSKPKKSRVDAATRPIHSTDYEDVVNDETLFDTFDFDSLFGDFDALAASSDLVDDEGTYYLDKAPSASAAAKPKPSPKRPLAKKADSRPSLSAPSLSAWV